MWSTKDFKLLDDLYATDCILHQQREGKTITFQGLQAWRQYIEEFYHAYPEYQEKVIEQIAEGDKVVSLIKCSALDVHWDGVVIDLIERGKIKETWAWFKRSSDELCGKKGSQTGLK